MKGFVNTAFKAALAVAAALTMFSCSRELEMPDPVNRDESPVREVHFRAIPRDTRAQFGTQEDGAWPTLWTVNDSELKLSLNYGSAQTAGVTPTSDFKSASFSATIDFTGITGPYTFYAVSPASVAMALSPSREAWKVSIPCVQTPTANSAAENAIILASASYPYATAGEAEPVDLYFEHLTAYGCLSFSNLDLAGASVQAVELTATTPLVGDWYWNCEAGEDGHTLTDYGASSTLTINTSRTTSIWFGCAPVDLSGEIMVVSVFTDSGVFEKQILFDGEYQLTAGQVALFTVDMSYADYTAGDSSVGSDGFVLVTDETSLRAGDEVLIVYTDGKKALGPAYSSGSTSYRTPVDVSIENGIIASEGDATVLKLDSGRISDTWSFYDGTNYLASAGSGNYLKSVSSITDNASWSVSIDGDGLAAIQAQAGSSRFLCYNTQNPRFSCYTTPGTQKPVSIYRRTASSGVSTSDPLLDQSEYGCYLGTGLEWVLSPGAEQVTRAYDSNGVFTYTLIDPSEVEELEIVGYKKTYVKNDHITVSVHWRKGFATILSQTYQMTLIKEEGPKVWLSDGNGHGFIIKK